MMKHVTKKLTALLLTMLMLLGAVVPMSVGAGDAAVEPTYPTYAEAKDGDLLYRVNFNGDSYWQPTSQTSSGLKPNVVSDDGTQALMTDAAVGHFGTAVNGLYLDETSKYTVTFEANTVTNTSMYKGIAFSAANITGNVYGRTAYKQIGVEFFKDSKGCRLAYRTYTKRGYVVEGDVTYYNGSNGDMRSYAIEIDCENRTVKYYVLTPENTWSMVKEFSFETSELPTTAEYWVNGEYKEPFKLLFFRSGNAGSHCWNDVEIRKGNIISTGAMDMSENAFQFKTNEDGSKNLRIVSAIDSNNYTRIGYDVKINGAKVSAPAMTAVYSSLLATYGGNQSEITLETLGYHLYDENDYYENAEITDKVESGYLTSFVIKDIPSGTTTFELSLTPYTDTLDGDLVYGEEVVYTVDVANQNVTKKG